MIGLEDVQGHWQRAWLKAPGVVDHDTCVHWMQCGSLYADVRIPSDRPDIRGARALDELSPASLAKLMEAEGFAGEIIVEDGVCTWGREINWHGAPEVVDAGALEFTEDGALVETGVHADYKELWHQMYDMPDEGQRLLGENGEVAYLVTVGVRFVFGIGRPDVAATAPIAEALARGERPEGLEGLFGRLHALGHWERNIGVADLSTNPLVEGSAILTRRDSAVTWHSVGFHGDRRDVALSADGLRHAA